MKILEGKTAFISGASMGIGRGIAKVFSEKGAKVLLAARSPEIVQIAEDLGGKGYILDISDEEAVAKIGEEIINEFGPVDILVNNAGILRAVDPMTMDSDLRDFHLDVNVKGCWNITRAFFPHMLKRSYGRVVTVSSVTGPRVADAGMTAYAMSKAAILGFTRALAMDGVEHGVTANAILPGYVRSHMVERTASIERPEDPEGFMAEISKTIPMKRMCRPEEIGYLAAFLASDEAAYITGAEFVIDGGNGIQETHI